MTEINRKSWEPFHMLTRGEPSAGRHRVSRFHALTSELVESDAQVVPTACRFLGLDPDQAISLDEVREFLRRYANATADDIGPEQAEQIRAALATEIGAPRTYGEMLRTVERSYQVVGKVWAALLTSFVAAILREAQQYGVSDIVFLARDGILFDVVYRSMPARYRAGMTNWILDLNRGMVGVDGSSDSAAVSDETLIRHVRASVPQRRGVAIVDTGLYGTLVHGMARLGLLGDSLVLFFSSRNPHVYGFLQTIMASAAEQDFAILCCDTLESWPKPYRQARLVAGEAVAEAADPISLCAHLTLARSLAVGSGELDPDRVDPVVELAALDKTTAFGVPLLLPQAVEPWTGGPRLLDSEWDIGPLPPLPAPRRALV
ncbi:hypothetical protein ACFRAO_37370 [Streptomyces sp. NPDC056656]|uniref:hypothetical protein n=1 Tax=Streptomyces sp. NPDC056656 TaxID=3345895 RepID=UPI0036BAD375